MKRAIGYVRTSTDEQETSVEAQRMRIEGLAMARELHLVEVAIDRASGKSLDRPELVRVLAMLEAGEADALIVAKLDRLTRSVGDLDRLLSSTFRRVDLLSAGEAIDTTTPGGRLMLNIIASVAQWERETIGERISVAKLHMSAKNEHVGGRAPYGWMPRADDVPRHLDGDGVLLVPVESEQAVIAAAREMRAAGMSLRAISRELAARACVSRTGAPFLPVQIKRMLARPVRRTETGEPRSIVATSS
jgi:site-specific DNA recombinase